MAHPTVDISIAIVSYNTRDLLRACLASLRARQEEGEVKLEVWVADNGSRDGSPEMVQTEFSEFHVFSTGSNIGYGRANNMALEKAIGRFFMVLNSDTEVQPGALRALVEFMEAHPDCGIAGPKLILPNGSTQGSCSRDPNLLDYFWEQTYLYKLLPQNRITAGYTYGEWAYDQVREVPQMAGACFFIRRETWQQTGGFDSAYFMYFEDTDFCLRARKLGWKIYFVPQAVLLHHVGASSGGDWCLRARMITAYNQSRLYFYRRYEGALRAAVLKAVFLLGALLRIFGWSFLGVIRKSAREKTRIFRAVLRQTWRS